MDSLISDHPYLAVILFGVVVGIVLLWNETTKYSSPQKKDEVLKEKTPETIMLIIGLIILGIISVAISNAFT
jgi:hypothetical protein